MTTPAKRWLTENEGQQVQTEESTHKPHHHSASRWDPDNEKWTYDHEILCEGTAIA